MPKAALIERIIALTGPVPKPERYRQRLQRLNERELAQKHRDLAESNHRTGQAGPKLGRARHSMRAASGPPSTLNQSPSTVSGGWGTVIPRPSDLPPGMIAAVTENGRTRWVKSSNTYPKGHTRRGYN